MSETPFDISKVKSNINMNEVVKDHNILFLCLDTLRYDVAKEAEIDGSIPTLNKYGNWCECIAPGNFTYPSHHTMFIGFLPAPKSAKSITDRELLFFPRNIGLNKAPENAFLYDGENFIQGLANIDYHTLCIGGVAFFDKRSDIGKIFPNMFIESHWQPKFGCVNKNSAKYQVDYAIKCIERLEPSKKVFCYINFSAIHYPNFHYSTDSTNKKDNLDTHKLALEYVDSTLQPLFDCLHNKGKTFVIVTSDHGTCYGEEGYHFHGINHDNINTVPYKHFFL